ncbi:phosphotransferase enzyme family protein [Oceanobacillus kapialis]|uniref:phosphotransferase enzyme family protein n=1 Tax=Oceanobacillus kapialis TaxID=481353 RepID=UPI0038506CD3
MEQKILGLLNEKYALKIQKVEAVTNEMFRCIANEGEFFARVTNYKNYEEQLEEVNYTSYLHKRGFGVSPVITSINGKVVENIPIDGRELLTVLYQAAPGIHLPRKQWDADVLKELGRQIGKLHHLSKQYEDKHPVKYIRDWHENEEYAFHKYIPKEETTIRNIAEEVVTTIKKLPKSTFNYGLLHGDLWLGNILVDKDLKLTMVDFQDCEKHFYIFDLAVPIYSAVEYSFVGGGNISDYRQQITQAIIKGYQEENTLSIEMIDQLPLFIKLKEIFEYSLMHMYWDQDKLTENEIRIMNHFRMRIEHDHSFLGA